MRIGLGKLMMRVVELVARQFSMEKVVLTVQDNNAAAHRFYSKLNYVRDETDPALCDACGPEYGYSILSKPILQ